MPLPFFRGDNISVGNTFPQSRAAWIFLHVKKAVFHIPTPRQGIVKPGQEAVAAFRGVLKSVQHVLRALGDMAQDFFHAARKKRHMKNDFRYMEDSFFHRKNRCSGIATAVRDNAS